MSLTDRISKASCSQVVDVISLLQKSPFKNPIHLAQQQDPWRRLSSIPKITSMRRDAYVFDSKVLSIEKLFLFIFG